MGRKQGEKTKENICVSCRKKFHLHFSSVHSWKLLHISPKCCAYATFKEGKRNKQKDLDCILEFDPIKRSRSNALKLNELHLWPRVRSRKKQRRLKLCKPVGYTNLSRSLLHSLQTFITQL